MSEWVCPHCPKASAEKEIEKIQGLNRLYAFPCEPKFNNNSLVIIDSGAFGLSQSGGKMSFKYMQRLSEHYKKYYQEGITLCVAPDEFLNPEQSMLNFKCWHSKGLFEHITPVIQAEQKGRINLEHLIFQAEFYREKSDTIFFSNNGLTAKDAEYLHLEKLFKHCKRMKYKWIHCLGAGWNIQDLKKWSEMKYLDSFDSIAYYTAKDENVFGSLEPVENVRLIIECLKI